MRLFLKSFIILSLFVLQPLNEGCQLSRTDNKLIALTESQTIVAGSQGKNDFNLKFEEDNSKPLIYGEKVDITLLPAPASSYQNIKDINQYDLQSITCFKRRSAIISHFNLLISTTLQISPLVNVLRI